MYLYRPDKIVGGGITPPVYLNNREMFELPNEGYVLMEIAPGEHVLETRKPKSILTRIMVANAVGEAKLNLEAGKTYYVKWLPYVEDFGVVPLATPVAHATFNGTSYLMTEQAASPEIAGCKRVYP